MTQKLKISIRETKTKTIELSSGDICDILYLKYILAVTILDDIYDYKTIKCVDGKWYIDVTSSITRPATKDEIKAYHFIEYHKYEDEVHGTIDGKEFILEVVNE